METVFVFGLAVGFAFYSNTLRERLQRIKKALPENVIRIYLSENNGK